jgi:hypothetical protein
MTIDRYRIGWAELKMRKEGVDAYLAEHRRQAKPMINVDVVVFVLIAMCAVFLFAFMAGYHDGVKDRTAKQSSAPYSPVTKCTSYDIRDGQKYCLAWKRV